MTALLDDSLELTESIYIQLASSNGQLAPDSIEFILNEVDALINQVAALAA